MLPMRSAAAAVPCSLAAFLLRSCSSSRSPICSIHALSAFSCCYRSTAPAPAARSPPLPLSRGPRGRGFAAWASAPGAAETPATKALEAKIKEKLEADAVTVVDTSGDGRHVCIDVVSKAFEGKSAVNRQRMVYKVIWEELQSTVHAVDQMSTKTPAEAASSNK